jgi:ABC-type sugar transport system ATPase subunit
VHQGRVEQIGELQELMEHPATDFVAAFMDCASIDFCPATLQPSGDGLSISLAQYPFRWPVNQKMPEAKVSGIRCGIRTNDWIILSESKASL